MDNRLDRVSKPLSQIQIDGVFSQTLTKIQGNILKAHGRNYAAHLILNLARVSRREIMNWFADFADKYVTSATQQSQQVSAFKKLVETKGSLESARRVDRIFFGAMFFTAEGYKKLGYLKTNDFRDPSFVAGMKISGPDRLGDPPVESWQDAYRQPVHAMLLIANNNRQILEEEAKRLVTELGKLQVDVNLEIGTVSRNEDDQLVDPFQYAHGVSQPQFFAEEVRRYKATQKAPKGSGHWDTSAGPDLVLVQDPFVPDDIEALGSYVVFRKLEMKVKEFNAKLAKLATALRLGSGDDAIEYAAALVLGRFRTGAPLVAWRPKTRLMDLPRTNNFDYRADASGSICPFQSHVRKANPRGLGPNGMADERQHRIVRRGMNYTEATSENTSEKGESLKQGMLFICYQARILRQFEFMQKRWLNDENFPREANGRDPISGQGEPWRPQKWQSLNDSDISTKLSFGDFVQLKGGDYFFAPSITFLKNLRGESERASKPHVTSLTRALP